MEHNNLIITYTPLVRSIAYKYRSYGIPLEDLVQEGLLGILEAAKRYEEGRGAKFATYASFWIKKNIIGALEREKKETLHAVSITEEMQIPCTDNEAEQQPLKVPGSIPAPEASVLKLFFEDRKSLNEIAQQLNIPRERVRRLKQKVLRRIKINCSLTKPLYSLNSNSVNTYST